MGPRCGGARGCNHRRRSPGGQRLAHVNGELGSRAWHLAARGWHRRRKGRSARGWCIRCRAAAVWHAHRHVWRNYGAAGAPWRMGLHAGGRAPLHLRRAGWRRQAGGGVRHHEVQLHRALAQGRRRCHGHFGRRCNFTRAAQPASVRLRCSAHRHHRGGRKYSHAHADDLRAGRHSLPSLRHS